VLARAIAGVLMSIFASRATNTIPIPFDPPHTVTIRRLAGWQLHKAALENQLTSIETFRRMGGAQFQKELNEIRTAPPATDGAAPAPPAQEAPDPLAGYDKYLLMRYGIVSWTYEESLKPEAVVDEDSEQLVEATRRVIEMLGRDPRLAGYEAVTNAAKAILEAAKSSRVVVKALEDLTEEDADFFAREILRWTKPSLFMTADEAEADTKNA
jgi:hypothetical protein